MYEPKTYPGIMVSSTFTDLTSHRGRIIDAIHACGCKANVMEFAGPRADADVIESSLQMVRDSAVYLCVISHKYGQTPFDAKRNHERLSLTELEFNEAMRLDRPILLFIMSEDHAVKPKDIERDPENARKLNAFRQRAKQTFDGSEVHRIYGVFNDEEELAIEATKSIARIAPSLQPPEHRTLQTPEPGDGAMAKALALAALPAYLGSHKFVGRKAQLDTLNDWCAEADQTTLLLFEAIGGTGKSILTWTWLTEHAPKTRDDWVGRFWFSFYEQGATMAGFCRAALAYTTRTPRDAFVKTPIREVMDRLVAELRKQPWLMVLDGFERVLVTYHRADAAQLPDEAAETSTDLIGERDPCSSIRPEDDDLLQRLREAAPSKILITSRLMPRALLNSANQPLPGVRREPLTGLRPVDGEILIRACGVSGDTRTIQDFMQKNCDCHPLVIGALAGLINDYLPDRGNFDKWAADPAYGGKLNLADLNLVNKRNHILSAAIDALAPEGRQLLQTLALLQGGSDYDTLRAFNPHLPPPLEPAKEPQDPQQRAIWSIYDEKARQRAKAEFKENFRKYLEAHEAWKRDPVVSAAGRNFDHTLRDLEKRGLLQYDTNGKRYDLHPVVRGVAKGRLNLSETERLGKKVVDHFSSRPHDPWEHAETLADVAQGLQVVQVLLQMQQYEQALNALRGDLVHALWFNLDANSELQALYKAFFPDGWDAESKSTNERDQSWLLCSAASVIGNVELAQRLHQRALLTDIRANDLVNAIVDLGNLSDRLHSTGYTAEATRLVFVALAASEAAGDKEQLFVSKLRLYGFMVDRGDEADTDRLWQEIDSMGRDWSRGQYRPGDAEFRRALDFHYRGELSENYLREVEALAARGRNRGVIRELHRLRSNWHLGRCEYSAAEFHCGEALRMAREVGESDFYLEAELLRIRQIMGQDRNFLEEAERLSRQVENSPSLAEVWDALGERERAITLATNYHRWAVADGEPFVHRHALNRACDLLSRLGSELIEIPKHDSTKDKSLPWEADLNTLIEKVRTEGEAAEAQRKERAEKNKPD